MVLAYPICFQESKPRVEAAIRQLPTCSRIGKIHLDHKPLWCYSARVHTHCYARIVAVNLASRCRINDLCKVVHKLLFRGDLELALLCSARNAFTRSMISSSIDSILSYRLSAAHVATELLGIRCETASTVPAVSRERDTEGGRRQAVRRLLRMLKRLLNAVPSDSFGAIHGCIDAVAEHGPINLVAAQAGEDGAAAQHRLLGGKPFGTDAGADHIQFSVLHRFRMPDSAHVRIRSRQKSQAPSLVSC